MLKPLHFPWLSRFFRKGTNKDLRGEFIPADTASGVQNMRPFGVDGSAGALVKIGGEVVLYPPDEPGAATYVCVGAVRVNGHTVAYWASSTPGLFAPLIKIDGTTMAQHPDIPYTFDHMMQMPMTLQDGCETGIIYPVDGNAPALFWDVQDIIDNFNSGSVKYFSGFVVTSQFVNPTVPANFPRFMGLKDVGAPSGVPSGQVRYAIRYTFGTGDKTNIGLWTPLIPIPFNSELTTPQTPYPGGRSTGSDPLPIPLGTRYATVLNYRIDNYNNFTSIEIIRQAYTDGAGLVGAGEVRIVGRFNLAAQQWTPVATFQDPQDSNVFELVPPDEVPIETLEFTKPWTSEYSASRLEYGNVQLASQVPTGVTFREVSGNKTIPFTKAMTGDWGGSASPAGYSDPLNATYNRSYMRGEKYGIYFSARSQTMRKFLSIPIEANMLMPYRRDIKAGESLLHSDAPCWAGNSTVDGVNPVTETFEAFEQGTRTKTDLLSIVNASDPASAAVGRIGPFLAFPSPPAGTNVVVALFDFDGTPVPGYRFNPANSPGALALWQPSTNFSDDHSYLIPPNTGRLTGNSTDNPIGFQNNTGAVFAPTPQALGVGIYGVQNMPPEIGSFSISRTAPAGRVVAEGIGIYDLVAGNSTNCATKQLFSLRAFFPDADAGLIDQNTLDAIEANPGDYSIQCTPVGFYSEVYGYHGDGINVPPILWQEATRMDMISYANLLHDEGQVNVGDNVAHGAQPTGGAPPGNYTAPGWWRQTAEPTASIFRQPGNDGNTLIDIGAFTPVTNGRGRYYRIGLQQAIYTTQGNMNWGSNGFQSASTRNFHEPWYIIKIIKIGAEPDDNNQVLTVDTGFNIKREATVGIQQDANAALYPRVDERWEDYLGEFPTDYRYIWIKPPTGGTEAWVCISNNAFFAIPANVAIVLAAIAGGGWTSPDGILVTGLYEATKADVIIGFAYPQFIPPVGSRINVRYNDQALLRVLGGDVTIAPAIWAPEDNLLDTEPDTGGAEGFFSNSCPLPYAGFQLNPRYLMPWKSSETEQHIAINLTATIRQWCVTFLCESRVPQTLNVNVDGSISDNLPNDQLQFFPAKHYVIRPYGSTSDLSGFYVAQYDQAYPNEQSIINYGGFRFLPGVNFDYAKQPPVDYTSLPVVGFEENLDGCNWLLASTKLNPEQQDVPGIRTFLQSGVRVISEEAGPIWRIGSATYEQGQNIHIWTENAVGRILVDKSVLTGADGQTIGLQAVDTFWGQEQWLSRTTGLPKQLRNLWTRWENSFWWPDEKGFWQLPGDFRNSISSGKYDKDILPLLKLIPENYGLRIAASYDPIHREVWFTIPDLSVPNTPNATRTFAYSAALGEWVGEFTFVGDQYLSAEQDMLSFRGLTTYTMNTGYTLNGATLTAFAEAPFKGDIALVHEAIAFRAYPDKPSRIELYDKAHNLIFFTDFATQEAAEPGTGTDWIMDIDGWQQDVGRKNFSIDPNEDRCQSELFYLRIIYNEANDRILTVSQLQLQKII